MKLPQNTTARFRRILACSTLLFFISTACLANTSLLYLNRILRGRVSAAGRSIRRISSGRQLLVDNPADYVIYEKLEGYIRSLDKSIGNAADMLSYYRYEGGMLRAVLKPLQRIRGLILKRSGGILSPSDRSIINNEIRLNYRHIIRLLKQSSFNSIYPFRKFFSSAGVRKHFTFPRYFTFTRVDRLLKFFLRRIAVTGVNARRLRHQIRTLSLGKDNKLRYQSRMDTAVGAEMGRFKRNQVQLMINILMLKTK